MCVSHYRRHLDGRGGRAASRTQKYAAVLCANTVGVVNGFIVKQLKETIVNVLDASVEATNASIEDLRATYHLDRAVLSCVDVQSSKTRGQPDSRLFNYRRLQTVSLVEVSLMFSRYFLDYSHSHFSALQRLIIYRGEELSEADDVLFGHQHNINYMRHRDVPRVGEVGDDGGTPTRTRMRRITMMMTLIVMMISSHLVLVVGLPRSPKIVVLLLLLRLRRMQKRRTRRTVKKSGRSYVARRSALPRRRRRRRPLSVLLLPVGCRRAVVVPFVLIRNRRTMTRRRATRTRFSGSPHVEPRVASLSASAKHSRRLQLPSAVGSNLPVALRFRGE